MRWVQSVLDRPGAVLFVAVLSLALGHSCSNPRPPALELTALAKFLGQDTGLLVDAQRIRWEPSRGFLLDALLGRRVLYLARSTTEAPRDVYRSRVRVSWEGQPLSVEATYNLTNTPLGDEAVLEAAGGFAAFASFSREQVQGVTVLDLTGARREDLVGSWLNRVLLRLRESRRSGDWRGISRHHVRFAPTEEVQLHWARDELLIETEAGRAHLSLVNRTLRDEGLAAEVTAQPLGSTNWVHNLVDIVREETGPRLVSWLTRQVFGFRDAVRDLGEEPEFPRTDPEARYVAVAASRSSDEQWPPNAIETTLDPALQGEGAWSTVAPPWDTAGARDALPFAQTFLRPDPEQPEVVLHFVALDMRRLELRVEAGFEEPRPKAGPPGRGRLPSDPRLQQRVRATFNGAFKSVHGDYGMVVDERVIVPPVPGAATWVNTTEGRTGFGVWPTTTQLPPRIRSLRQNLDPLIASGKINPTGRQEWGEHLFAEGVRTERSALCLGPSGHVYYAYGRDLSATTLARGLQQAGCQFAMHLDMNPGHCGFFYHRVGDDGALEGYPAWSGLEISPLRFAEWSSQDFFYVVEREQPELGKLDWQASPGVQPGANWSPALLAARQELGPLSIDLFWVRAKRIAPRILAGSQEPLIAGRPAPVRELGVDPNSVLFALNLGHTTERTRYGLSFSKEATLPLRQLYGTLLLTEHGLEMVRSGEEIPTGDSTAAVQLPELMRAGQVTDRAREPGAQRVRGALCVLDEGSLLIARAAHDSSAPLALTLRDLGCEDVLEMDRGSQHPVFLHRGGTDQSPRFPYATTVLIGLSRAVPPETFTWDTNESVIEQP